MNREIWYEHCRNLSRDLQKTVFSRYTSHRPALEIVAWEWWRSCEADAAYLFRPPLTYTPYCRQASVRLGCLLPPPKPQWWPSPRKCICFRSALRRLGLRRRELRTASPRLRAVLCATNFKSRHWWRGLSCRKNQRAFKSISFAIWIAPETAAPRDKSSRLSLFIALRYVLQMTSRMHAPEPAPLVMSYSWSWCAEKLILQHARLV